MSVCSHHGLCLAWILRYVCHAHCSPVQELIEMRRLGLTKLGEKSGNDGLFSYVHLRVALPQPLEDQEIFGVIAPELYFLMRRSKDGYVSSTGMSVCLLSLWFSGSKGPGGDGPCSIAEHG